jgi:hypothetical protein
MTNTQIDPGWRHRAGQTVAQAQAILPASRATIWRKIQSGDLEVFRIGWAVRIKTSSLVRLVEGDAEGRPAA